MVKGRFSKNARKALRRPLFLVFAGVGLLALVVAAFLVAAAMRGESLGMGMVMGLVGLEPKLTQEQLDAEVMQEFVCTCCGQPVAECGCGTAKDMRDYLSAEVARGVTKDELLVSAAKRFGTGAFARQETVDRVTALLAASAGKDAPKIEIEPASKDLGEVSQAKGKTSTDFIVRNTGESDLVIDSLDTSCMCTSAQIIHVHDDAIPHVHPEEIEGPVFGMSMHGGNPGDWSATVPPGASAILRVFYDPNVHGDLRGYVQRKITVYSNDPVNFQSTVSIEFEQVA